MYIVEMLKRGPTPLISLMTFEDPTQARDFYYAQHPYYDVVTLWIDDIWVLRHDKRKERLINRRVI